MLLVVTPRPFARSLLVSVALGAPFVLAAHAASAFVTPLTKATVAALVCITRPLVSADAAPEPDTFADEAESSEPETVVAAITNAPRRGVVKVKLTVTPTAIFVSVARVLELARSAARPRGSFVAQTPEHPAGLRLSGVSALGIGVQDGDILIDALGATPRSPGQVIGAIIEARAKEPRFLSGVLSRHGQRIPITVEQPYLRQLPLPSDEPTPAALP